MEKEVDPDIIKTTQNSLGKYVKRPPLSEKLLKKPPFRFLHDIVTTVLKTTGFFEGLFDTDELVSDNVKDRDSKIAFLNKVISVVATTTGQHLAIKPSKIVAGQEPEKTNELLQCLATALERKLSSDEAVKKYKEELKVSGQIEKKAKEQIKPVKKTTETKKLTSNSSEQLTTNKRDSERSLPRNEKNKTTGVKLKQKDTNAKKESPPKKISEKSSMLLKKDSAEKSEPKVEVVKEPIEKKIRPNATEHKEIKISAKQEDEEDSSLPNENESYNDSSSNLQHVEQKSDLDQQDKLNISYVIAEHDLNSSLSSQDLMELDNNKSETEETVLKFPVELNTNRQKKSISHNKEITDSIGQVSNNIYNNKGKVNIGETEKKLKTESSIGSNSDISETSKDSHKNNSQEENKKSTRPVSVRPSSSRPGAPRLREKYEPVLNTAENLLIGKVNIIAENTTKEEDEDNSIIIVDQQVDLPTQQNQQETLQFSSNEHGHLVQQILESQKELSHISGKTEIEWEFGAQKARDTANQEIEKLRYNIQALSRVANPLGKLLDHIQEDVEIMRQELLQWSKTNDETSKELLKQKTANEDSLYPLHSKLKQLDLDIEEKQEKINDLKIVIHKNSSRIERLLLSGDVQ